MLKTFALVFGLAVLPIAAHGEDTSAKVISAYDQGPTEERPMWELSFSNTYEGFITSNALLIESRNASPMFCPAGDLVITGDQLIEILRAGLKRKPVLAGIDWRASLLLALVDRYPCRAAKGDKPWY